MGEGGRIPRQIWPAAGRTKTDRLPGGMYIRLRLRSAVAAADPHLLFSHRTDTLLYPSPLLSHAMLFGRLTKVLRWCLQ